MMEKDKGITERILEGLRQHLAKYHGPRSVGPAELKEGLGTLAEHGNAHHSPNFLEDQTIGIADDNLVEIDHAAVADDDYAKFTVNGLEGRSYAEVKEDLSLEDADINTLAVTAVEAADPLDMTNAIQVDQITEHTGDAGVLVDLTKMKDGLIYPSAVANPDMKIGKLSTSFYFSYDGDNFILYSHATGKWYFFLGAASEFEVTATILDAKSKPIQNVTDPTNDQDAATKKYVVDNAVLKTLFDATTFLYATDDNTPQAKTPAEVMVILPAATTSAPGKVELATVAETQTGTDAGRVVTPDGLRGAPVTVIFKVLAHDTALTTGDGKEEWTVPSRLNGFDLVDADVAVYTASTAGGNAAVGPIQIYNVTQTADMLSTGITLDQDEKNSYTAATQPVIDTGNDDVATGDVLRFDVDTAAGTGTKGFDVHMVFQEHVA